MPSLERFFNPQMRVFSANITSLPSARLYFFQTGSTTPKVTYADKQGLIPNENPVIASATGSFPPIFLDGLYRVELRSSANIVQPGWPIDNVGQDSQIVPYAPWSEIVTYAEFERVTDTITGIVYRSKVDGNLGNVPDSSPSEWEVVIDPVPSSFTSDAPYFSWADAAGLISLDVDLAAMVAAIAGMLTNLPNKIEFDFGKIQVGADAGAKTFFRSDAKFSTDDINYFDVAGRSSVRDEVGGGFDAGQEVVIEKIGNTVTISSAGPLTHPSASTRLSGAIIPSDYRIGTDYNPGESIGFSFISNAGYLTAIEVDFEGRIRISYFDYAGAAVSRTDTGKGFSVSYTITSQTP